MKLTFVFALALLLPATASAGPAECARLDRQIQHFQGMVERAEELDNELWEERTQDHVDLLLERRERACPDASDEEALRAFATLLGLAGRAALAFFTFGAF